MRGFVLCAALLSAAVPAMAADPNAATCAECAVVRSVKAITKELKPPDAANDPRPSGLVATIPLDGGKTKSHTGSSARIGKEAMTKSQTWEVVVRYDDGRFRVFRLEQQPDVKEGDRVRIDANGKIAPRTD
jgi:hypothetical protein